MRVPFDKIAMTIDRRSLLRRHARSRKFSRRYHPLAHMPRTEIKPVWPSQRTHLQKHALKERLLAQRLKHRAAFLEQLRQIMNAARAVDERDREPLAAGWLHAMNFCHFRHCPPVPGHARRVAYPGRAANFRLVST